MYGVKIVVDSSFGNNVNNSKFVKTAKKLDKEVLRGTKDVDLAFEIGKQMYKEAFDTVHVLTRNLRDRALKLEKTKDGFVFFVDKSVAHYGGIEEFRHPYFYPAVDRNRNKIAKQLMDYYKNITKTT